MEPSYSLDQKTVQLRAYSMQKAKVKAIARTSYSKSSRLYHRSDYYLELRTLLWPKTKLP